MGLQFDISRVPLDILGIGNFITDTNDISRVQLDILGIGNFITDTNDISRVQLDILGIGNFITDTNGDVEPKVIAQGKLKVLKCINIQVN